MNYGLMRESRESLEHEQREFEDKITTVRNALNIGGVISFFIFFAAFLFPFKSIMIPLTVGIILFNGTQLIFLILYALKRKRLQQKLELYP